MTNLDPNKQSLFDRIGGAPAVDAAVDIFYRRVLGDDRISHYFGGTDMVAQRQKQKAFLTMVFGGPNHYAGKDLRAAHAGLKGLNDSHFDAVAGHLVATLQQLGVAADIIAEVGAIADGARPHVLNR
jgi:hemoglobin